MERDEAGIQRFVEHLGGLYEASGMARLPARLMARFLIDEDGRMTSAEIAEQLARIRQIAMAHDPVEFREAADEDQARRIWLGRKSAFGAMRRRST